MNVTETGSEYRQLRIEDFLEAEPAEQVECPGSVHPGDDN